MIRHHHNPFYHTHLACPVWRSVPTVQRSLPTFTRVVPPSCRPTSTRHRTAAYTACHAMTGRLFSHSMYDVYILTDAVLLAEKSASGVSVSSVWINGVLVPRSVQCVYLYLGMDYRCGNRQPHCYISPLLYRRRLSSQGRTQPFVSSRTDWNTSANLASKLMEIRMSRLPSRVQGLHHFIRSLMLLL